MAKTKKKPKPSPEARFRVGDRVRVRHGVRDEDYPDMPLGGWAGEVTELLQDHIVAVRWSQQTLDAMHPVFRSRSAKDGLDLETYYLEDGELEPDPGGPLKIEQPTEIKTKPLDPKDQDDRVRMVFGLTSNDPLPEVNDQMLAVYHRHLSQTLTFPFEVEYSQEFGPFQDRRYRVKVTGLLDPDECDEMYGLFCEGRSDRRKVELPLGEFNVHEDDPKLQPLADYCYWFCNYQKAAVPRRQPHSSSILPWFSLGRYCGIIANRRRLQKGQGRFLQLRGTMTNNTSREMNAGTILETSRLILREWLPDDWVQLKPIATNPQVIRYVGMCQPPSDEQIRAYIEAARKLYRDEGFCLWPLVYRESQKLIGFCGFDRLWGGEEIEIGYWLAPDYWGEGLATEAAQAVMRYGRERLGLRQIAAVAHPENKASIRVLEKIGMVYVKNVTHEGVEHVYYRCEASGSQGLGGRPVSP